MATSRYFRGVKLEAPSVTAYRAKLLTRQRREAEAAVGARVRPAAAPSVFRDLRPGDQIVRPASRTITTSSTTTKSPLTQAPASPRMIPPEPEPVAAILARRRAAADRMAVWLRGGAPSLDPAARPPEVSASAVPTKRTEPTGVAPEPEPLADVFARRQRTIARARPWMRED